MKTIHIIPNAHIDPVWLWPWQAGLDAALATCRSACERLENHPDLTFCQGEAWIYREIEKCDPALFDRIKNHIRTGRWEIVGGWWIQPDCNGPSGWALDRQITLGLNYFMERFKIHPRTAYNIDSFGHAATLPTIMRRFNQDRYVMMRPQEHEMQLPARIFRWQEKEGSPEVTVFRISGSYNMGADVNHLRRSISELPKGLEHTMCYFGVGDHGGGPTEMQIAQLRELKGVIDGWHIEFSTPDRFFNAVEKSGILLPSVIGELQHHAIGCYSVCREIKNGVRYSEHQLLQAEVALKNSPIDSERNRLQEAWEIVSFNHFHDTYGGTCIPSANKQAKAQLGMAQAIGEDISHHALRRMAVSIPEDHKQGLIFFNASDRPYAGPVEIEPWTDWQNCDKWVILDEEDQIVSHQTLETECQVNGLRRFLFHLELKPGQMRVLRVDTTPNIPHTFPSKMIASDKEICGPFSAVSFIKNPHIRFMEQILPLPEFELLNDSSDTWSHGIDRYSDDIIEKPVWGDPVHMDSGPLMASLIRSGKIGNSTLIAEWRTHANEKYIELRLRVMWIERRRLLKMRLSLEDSEIREDGILGGSLKRKNDGRELPYRDWSLSVMKIGNLGIVAPDCFALDATSSRIRFTLLRSPVLAHHDPHLGDSLRSRFSDQGEHEFRFQFHFDGKLYGKTLDQNALMLQRPLLYAETTKGMISRL